MIRRDSPLSGNASNWLLIPQEEHARLSYTLATAWSKPRIYDLFPDSSTTQEEVLQLIRLHDRGWRDWDAMPAIEPTYGRPYGFTEMPPLESQRIWSKSIAACRVMGPFSGWVVAGHFVHLQSDVDEDYEAWKPWLKEYEALRQEWLDQWLSQDPRHTEEIAGRALFLLQAFDWLSLWLCCRAPLLPDEPSEETNITGEKFQFGCYTLTADRQGVGVEPWPFFELRELPSLTVDALRIPARRYETTAELLNAAAPTTLSWRLNPEQSE